MDKKKLLDIIRLFASLRSTIDGTGGEATAMTWSDAMNGRICIEMGPKNARPFVTVRAGWNVFKSVWETQLNWASIGSMDIEAAVPYTDVLKRLADLGPEIKRLIADADVQMENRAEGLEAIWALARNEAGEEAEPDEIASRACQTLLEACNTSAPSSRGQGKPARRTKPRETARRTKPSPRRGT